MTVYTEFSQLKLFSSFWFQAFLVCSIHISPKGENKYVFGIQLHVAKSMVCGYNYASESDFYHFSYTIDIVSRISYCYSVFLTSKTSTHFPSHWWIFLKYHHYDLILPFFPSINNLTVFSYTSVSQIAKW